jgi:molecular chaperone GrpE
MENQKESTVSPEVSAGAAAAEPDMTAKVPASRETELPEDLAAAYRKAVAEKQDLYDRLLRKQAELENFRKRTEREKEEFLKHATADLIRALLPALDSFERALKHRDPKAPPQFYHGMELIHREILEVLGRAGLSPVEAKGKVFDPHFHQAVETVESPEHRDQEIVEELQRGYKLKQRLLRPAIVKVATAPKNNSSPNTTARGKASD